MWRFCGVKLPILSLSKVSTRLRAIHVPRIVHPAWEGWVGRAVRGLRESKEWRSHLQISIPRVAAVPSFGLACHLLFSHRTVASCKRTPSHPSRLRHRKFQDPKFDWSLFWKFLSPDLVYLCLAVLVRLANEAMRALFTPKTFVSSQSAVVVAVLNFQIPLFLGQLVNIVAALEPGKQLSFYAAQLVQPGTKLFALYCVQVGGDAMAAAVTIPALLAPL